MKKIAVLAGRPENGTILPKTEKFIWKEIKRIIRKDVAHFSRDKVEFLIPVYSKFDIEVMRVAEEQGFKVTQYLPDEHWGLSRLPQFQVQLIARMRENKKVVPGHFMERMIQMIHDADYVYVLSDTKDFTQFLPYLKDKPVINFSKKDMLYTTEEEADTYYAKLKENTITYLSPTAVSTASDTKMLSTLINETPTAKHVTPDDLGPIDMSEDEINWYMNKLDELN